MFWLGEARSGGRLDGMEGRGVLVGRVRGKILGNVEFGWV